MLGFIPAGAGEPRAKTLSQALGGVYPRGCGGASPPVEATGVSPGLSPRVRGSPCTFGPSTS